MYETGQLGNMLCRKIPISAVTVRINRLNRPLNARSQSPIPDLTSGSLGSRRMRTFSALIALSLAGAAPLLAIGSSAVLLAGVLVFAEHRGEVRS